MHELSKDVADTMVMTAAQFDALSDDQIDQLPVLPLVIARCAPNTKVRMIEALHRRKKFCAMTGDGVNDSPSLKRADVGIAMGQAGSDVAKDASDIILTDDNFASILAAIEEGRRTFDNIQKFVLHLLAQNISQALILLIGLIFKDGEDISVFPLAPVEIMWIIMITSGLPDMGLGFEVAAPDVMQRPPQSLKRGVFTIEVMVDILVYGIWIAALCLASFVLVLYGWGTGEIGFRCNDSIDDGCDTIFRARATCFATLTWFSLFLAWEVIGTFPSQAHRCEIFTNTLHRHAPLLLPHATRFDAILHTMDARYLAQQVPLRGHHGRLHHHLPGALHPRHRHCGIQAHGHQLGMGHCLRQQLPVLCWCRRLEVDEADILPTSGDQDRGRCGCRRS